MISTDTISGWFAEFNRECKDDDTNLIKLQADFIESDPGFVALITTFMSGGVYKSPLAAALIALSMHRQLTARQTEADELKKSI